MTKTYLFYSAGSIPGIAGIFAGVAVEVDEASNTIVNTSPLNGSGAETTTATSSEVQESTPQQPSSDPEPAKE